VGSVAPLSCEMPTAMDRLAGSGLTSPERGSRATSVEAHLRRASVFDLVPAPSRDAPLRRAALGPRAGRLRQAVR